MAKRKAIVCDCGLKFYSKRSLNSHHTRLQKKNEEKLIPLKVKPPKKVTPRKKPKEK